MILSVVWLDGRMAGWTHGYGSARIGRRIKPRIENGSNREERIWIKEIATAVDTGINVCWNRGIAYDGVRSDAGIMRSNEALEGYDGISNLQLSIEILDIVYAQLAPDTVRNLPSIHPASHTISGT